MKKFLFIILILFISGCGYDKRNTLIDEGNNDIDNKEVETYKDDNPIHISLYNKKKRVDTYYSDFKNEVDLASFEVYYSDDDVVEGSNFKEIWNRYYNTYSDIDKYKIGYYISYTLDDGTSNGSYFFTADTYRYGDYFFLYFYDDVNAPSGYYSHIEEDSEEEVMSSVKIYGTNLDKVSSISVMAFTYDSDDFDTDGNYRGNSKYTINIKRK